MLILISQKNSRNNHGVNIDSLESSYIKFFENFDSMSNQPIIIPIPNSRGNVQRLLARFCPDLIVLSGGNNILPNESDTGYFVGDLAPERDEIEKILITFALRNKVPVLGICRGFQFINSFFGGKMTYKLNNHPTSKGHACIFEQKNYIVNSFHDHGIYRQELAEQLEPLAVTAVGDVIEAFESKPECGTRILGVQWHPEREDGGNDLFEILFSRFIGA